MKICPSSLTNKWFTRNCRNAGGLYLGIRFSFPTSVWDGSYAETDEIVYKGSNSKWQSCTLSVGFIFWTLGVMFNYDTQPLDKDGD